MKVISEGVGIPIKIWMRDEFDLEPGALEQAVNLSNLPFAFKWIAIMPDCHQGYGMPIGAVLAAEGAIVPNAVGVDIGCGMQAVKTGIQNIDTETLKMIMGLVRKVVPTGFDHHPTPQFSVLFDTAPDIPIIQTQLKAAKYQLGTLGGGNHFIEFQQDKDGYLWAMIHSGSRNFGFRTANHYHQRAVEMCTKWHAQLPTPDLAYLVWSEQDGQEYLNAMRYCMSFALANRNLIMDRIIGCFQVAAAPFMILDRLDVHHNYADIENHYGENVFIHRKGAIRVHEGEQGIIPGSMGSPSYIVEGMGNPESFYSCSHGAGRRLGRKETKRALNLIEEQEKMNGIVHGIRNEGDLEEAPGAYKDIDEVMKNQADLVRVVTKLRPIGSIKA